MENTIDDHYIVAGAAITRAVANLHSKQSIDRTEQAIAQLEHAINHLRAAIEKLDRTT